MRRVVAFLCFVLFVSSFFTSCDFLLSFVEDDEVPAVPSEDDDSNSLLGFPSEEVKGKSQIIEREAYTLLYSYDDLLPVWVSWHLDSDDFQTGKRDDNFRPDPELPEECQVKYADYIHSGFARGHICPNADRNITTELADQTYYMSNIAPQNSSFNSGDWSVLEEYCRKQALDGYELFIIAGVYGRGGVNSDGETLETYLNPDDGKYTEINIPSNFWKVVISIPEGDGDLSRIDEDTVAFAVDFPNARVPDGLDWDDYTCRIDDLEERTGLDFLSSLPDDIEEALESKMQSGV